MDLEEDAFAIIASLIARGVGVRDGMAAMLEHCRSRKRSAAWGRIGKLDLDADLARLEDWLVGVLTAEPPADDIDGLWFGLVIPGGVAAAVIARSAR